MMRRARFFRLSPLLFALTFLFAPAAVTAQEAPPVSNVGLGKGRDAGTLLVTWAAPGAVPRTFDRYRVEVIRNTEDGVVAEGETTPGDATATSLLVTGLDALGHPADQAYYVTVQVRYQTSGSESSFSQSVRSPGSVAPRTHSLPELPQEKVEPPGAPQRVECVGRTTSAMTLRWVASSAGSAESHHVRYRPSDGGADSVRAVAGATYPLSGLTAGNAYSVGVRAVAADGSASEWADAVCATPGSNPVIDLGGIAETLPGGKMTAVFVPALMMVAVMLSSTRNALLSFGCAGLVLVVGLFVVDASPLLLVALVPLVGAGFVYGKVLR